MVETRHYKNRRRRNRFITANIPKGEIVEVFYWNRGHKDGPEYHILTSNGLIEILNALTYRHITTLIARPGQIKRYYDAINESPPVELMELAYEHQMKGYNYK